MRSHLLIRSLWLLLCGAALVGALAVAPAVAAAAEGEETTTTEPPVTEPPPVVTQPPVETEVPTVPENPTSSPPSNSPPVSEAPSAEPVHSGGGGATTTTNTGVQTSGGGATGDANSGSTAASPATGTTGGSATRTHARSHRTRTTAGSRGGSGNTASGGGSKGAGTTSHNSPSHTAAPSGGGSTEPVVSPTDVTQGAEAFSHVASHVGEVFAQALPTKPLEDIGAKVLAHSGIVPEKGGKAQKDAVAKIGKALGAALLGSAVAVDRKPPSSSPDPISFVVDAPTGKSGTLYQLGILAVLLAAAVLIGREVRKGLGFGKPIMGWVEGARIARARRQPGDFKASVRLLHDRGRRAARRFRTQAVSGLRSMF